MAIEGIIIRIICGGAIGFCIGMTGIGGGVLLLPALRLILKLPPSVAVGTASLYALLTKVYATYEHVKLRTIDSKLTGIFLLGAIPTNILVGSFINLYLARHADALAKIDQLQSRINVFAVTVMLITAGLMIADLLRRPNKSQPGDPQQARTHLGMRRTVSGILLGALVGMVIGATSIGGGVLIIPILIFFFALRPAKTVGTSIVIGVVLTLANTVIYGTGGQMDWSTGLIMVSGSLVGVYYGSKLGVRIPDRTLKMILTLIILGASVMMLVSRQVAH
ncbi:hypothetical protein NKDENANG_03054 [Candidatus Entotheonellaceae bacterium PAL068K]